MIKIESPLSAAAKNFPNQPAIIDGNMTLSYHEFNQSVIKAMGWLERFVNKEGSRIAIFLPNCPEYIICLIALWRLGAISCLLNTRWPSKLAESTALEVACKYVICAPDIFPLPTQSSLKKINVYDIAKLKNIDGKDKKFFYMQPNRETTILFTSGTTSKPKTIVHTFANHYYNAKGSNENIPVTVGDRWLLSLPLYHVSGLGILFRTLLNGATIAIPENGQTLIYNIRKTKATHVSVVPTQLRRLFDMPYNFKILSRLKAILIGGSAVPEYLIKKSLERGLAIYKTYGLTETASQVATTTKGDLKLRTFSGATILPFRQVKIADDGEILVKGEILFKGYLKGKKIILPVTADGWFKTGDLGMINSNGKLEITGRKDNMFVSGGENIYPEEIERCLCGFPGVLEALVAPIPHKKYGERPVAFLKLKSKNRFRAQSMFEYLSGRLPRFKIPDLFYCWPREAIEDLQKISRRKLVEIISLKLQVLKPLA